MDIPLTITSVIAFVLVGFFLSFIILLARSKLVDSSKKKIKINNNDSLTKFVNGGSSLLSALTAQGIAVPCPCGGKATCKQCRIQVVQGGGDPLETDIATFTTKQIKEGWRLSCQCKVKEDISILLPDNILSLKEFEGVVISNQNVATFIKELVIEIPKEDLFSYQPGDYLQFHVPAFKTNTSDWKKTMEDKYFEDWNKFQLFDRDINCLDLKENEVIRAYSMASYPKEAAILKFNIRIASPPFKEGKLVPDIPWGICSSYTFSLKPGDKIKLSGPFGESHMIHDDRDLIFLIGGAGSSFGRSHILDLFYDKQTKRNVTLWYGARSLKENIYQQDFELLAKQYQNFSYRLVLSEPKQEDIAIGWDTKDPVKTNYLFRAFEQGQLKYMESPENALYYVCGPPMHNISVMKLLDQYGVMKENIILDDFGS